jgi:uracil-DNA glycosylase
MGWSERKRLLLNELGIRSPVRSKNRVSKNNATVGVTLLGNKQNPILPSENLPLVEAEQVSVAQALSVSWPIEIDIVSWPVLQQDMEQCTACPLHRERKRCVHGGEPFLADWMVVTDPPTLAEEQAGDLFTNESGRLFNNILRASGLSIELDEPTQNRAYITPIAKCKAPLGYIPQPDDLQLCQRFLNQQLHMVQPKVIVAMGRFALLGLLNSTEPLGVLRNQVHNYNGIPVIATYSPSYLLRQAGDKKKSWEDWCLAKKIVSGVFTSRT